MNFLYRWIVPDEAMWRWYEDRMAVLNDQIEVLAWWVNDIKRRVA